MSVPDRYVVVTPARDEEKNIRGLIESMARQTVPPAQWVVVNDGSTDRTGTILTEAAAVYDWMVVVHRADRGRREAGGGVIESFYDGFRSLTVDDWGIVVKLDSDLTFGPEYFERCVSEFRNDPNLGMGGGVVCKEVDGELEIEIAGGPAFHVRGATKMYRRACWDQISPLFQAPGWDTVDELKANMHGWTTHSFADAKAVQHRPTGEAAGNWSDAKKNGRACFTSRYHPLFMTLKCLKGLPRGRRGAVRAVGLAFGFTEGYIRRLQRVEDLEFRGYVHRQQLRKLTFRDNIWG